MVSEWAVTHVPQVLHEHGGTLAAPTGVTRGQGRAQGVGTAFPVESWLAAQEIPVEHKLNSPALTGQQFEQFATCVERTFEDIFSPAQRAVNGIGIRKRT